MVYSLDGNLIGTNVIDWDYACDELRPNYLPSWISARGFDITRDFNDDSFTQYLKSNYIRGCVHHIRFLPDFYSPKRYNFYFSKRHDFEESHDNNNEELANSVNPWYGKHDFEKILEALHVIKENYRNVTTIEIVYNTSCENTKEDDTRFDLFIEWLQSLGAITKVNFVIVGHEGIHKCDSILNRLPERLTSLNIFLTKSIESYKALRNQVFFTPKNGVYHYPVSPNCLNLICTNGNIMPLLNIKTVNVEIDIRNSGITREYLTQKFPDADVTISGRFAQQGFVLAYENIKDAFISFLRENVEYDPQSLFINNTELDLMVKDFVEQQENDAIHCLNLFYTNDHDSDNTTVVIRTSQSESDGGKKEISCDLYQNKEHLSSMENILALFGPLLTKLSVDFMILHENFSLNKDAFMTSICSNCQRLDELKIIASLNLRDTNASETAKQPNIELCNYISSYLANLADIFIEDFYSISGGDSVILGMIAEKMKNKDGPPSLRLFYDSGHPRDWSYVIISRIKEEESEKGITIYQVMLSPTSCSTDKVLQVLGPYTVQPHRYCRSSSNCGRQKYIANSLSRISQNLKTKNLSNHEPQKNIKEEAFNKNGLKKLKAWAGKKKKNTFHCLNLVYCDSKDEDLNSIRVTERLNPGRSENDNDIVTTTYSVRLDKKSAYETTNMALKAFGGFLTSLNIQFEEDPAHNFPFDEIKYLGRITRHCKVIKYLKIKNFPQTQEDKNSSLNKFKLYMSSWFDRNELDRVTKELAQIHFEIEQYPLRREIYSLGKILKNYAPLSMTDVYFEDMVACVELDYDSNFAKAF